MTPFMEKQLHEALVLACPELMKLSMGCKILMFGREMTLVQITSFAEDANTVEYVAPNGTVHDGTYSAQEVSEFVIIGHPIRLSHVLRAIEKQYPNRHIVVNWKGGFAEYKASNGEMGLWVIGPVGGWNLTTDSLSEQSPEFKSWLHSILCGA